MHSVYTDGNILVRKPIMKIDVRPPSIETSGTKSEAFFSVKQKNLAHVFSILRSSLYSDKALAMIREYCTNAQDAHVDAGKKDLPIQVKLPTLLDNTLTIRDFGKGLSNDGIFSVFNSYGESTKRDTDDLVGMLGIGSKSAFSYVNDFTIKSYHDGLLSVYIAYIDETNIGKISLIHTEPTNETGLEICITISPNHVRSYTYTFSEYLSRFQPTPTVLNYDGFENLVKQNTRKFIVNGDNWGIIRGSGRHIVRMGNVDYLFDFDTLKILEPELQCFNNSRFSIYLEAEIGSVVPSASRESLEMNSKTVDYIKGQLHKILHMIKDVTPKKIESIETMYEFMVSYDEFKSIYNLFRVPVIYRGHDYSRFQPTIDITGFYAKSRYSITRWERKFLNSDAINIEVNPDQVAFYYVNKAFSKSGLIPRLKKYGESLNHNFRCNSNFVLEFHTQEDADAFLENPDFLSLKKINLAEIELPKNVSLSGRVSVQKAECYWFRNGNAVMDCWNPVRDDFDMNDGGIYVPMKYYQPMISAPRTKQESMDSFKVLFKFIRALGFNQTIYGIRASDVDKLNSNWIPLDEYIQTYLDTLDENTKFKVYQSCITSDETCIWKSLFDKGLYSGDEEFSSLKSLLSKYVYQWRDRELGYAITHLTGLGYRFAIPEKQEIKAWIKHLSENYPILQIICERHLVGSCASIDIANSYIERG